MNAPRRTLILGLGNDLLTDDAIGLCIAACLEKQTDLPPGTAVCATTEMGVSLLDHMAGFDNAVIVDSVQTGLVPPGGIHVVHEEDLPNLPLTAPHFLGIGDVMALGRTLGMNVASHVRIIAVEVSDPYTVGTRLSPELEAMLPSLVEKVKQIAFGAENAFGASVPHPVESTTRPPSAAY